MVTSSYQHKQHSAGTPAPAQAVPKTKQEIEKAVAAQSEALDSFISALHESGAARTGVPIESLDDRFVTDLGEDDVLTLDGIPLTLAKLAGNGKAERAAHVAIFHLYESLKTMEATGELQPGVMGEFLGAVKEMFSFKGRGLHEIAETLTSQGDEALHALAGCPKMQQFLRDLPGKAKAGKAKGAKHLSEDLTAKIAHLRLATRGVEEYKKVILGETQKVKGVEKDLADKEAAVAASHSGLQMPDAPEDPADLDAQEAYQRKRQEVLDQACEKREQAVLDHQRAGQDLRAAYQSVQETLKAAASTSVLGEEAASLKDMLLRQFQAEKEIQGQDYNLGKFIDQNRDRFMVSHGVDIEQLFQEIPVETSANTSSRSFFRRKTPELLPEVLEKKQLEGLGQAFVQCLEETLTGVRSAQASLVKKSDDAVKAFDAFASENKDLFANITQGKAEELTSKVPGLAEHLNHLQGCRDVLLVNVKLVSSPEGKQILEALEAKIKEAKELIKGVQGFAARVDGMKAALDHEYQKTEDLRTKTVAEIDQLKVEVSQLAKKQQELQKLCDQEAATLDMLPSLGSDADIVSREDQEGMRQELEEVNAEIATKQGQVQRNIELRHEAQVFLG